MLLHVLVYMGDLQLVLSAQNSSILDAGILLMVQHVRLMMFSLIMVDYHTSFLLLWDPSFMHKSCGLVAGGGGWWPTAF